MRGTYFEVFACVACAWFLAGAVDAKARVEQPVGDDLLKARAEQPVGDDQLRARAEQPVGDDQLRFCAEEPVGDDPLKVYQKLGVRVPGIAGCLATAASFSVRIQSLKTSNGSVYSRQLVTAADLPCFENSTTKHLPAATHIGECAEATAREGLNSFLWEGNACTAFLAWRPRTRANCKDGGSKVVYVVNKQLTPFYGRGLISGVIRYESPRAFLDISYKDSCGSGVNVSKGYKIQFNGTEVKRLDAGTTTYSLEYKYLCRAPMNISLWAVGSDGKVNSNELQLEIEQDSNMNLLATGDCLYDPKINDRTIEESTADCHSKNLSLFYEKVDGEAAAFLNALRDINTVSYQQFHVGLRFNGTANRWEWLGGLVQPIVDQEVWDAGEPASNEDAHGGISSSDWRIRTGVALCATVCYVPIIA